MSRAEGASAPDAVDAARYGRDFADVYDEIFPASTVPDGAAAWLADLAEGSGAPAGAGLRVLELGAGTGRVLLPLLDELRRRGRRTSATAVDVSPEMLDLLAAAAEAPAGDAPPHEVATVVADISSEGVAGPHDLVLCVCATISMILSPESQERAVALAAEALGDDGVLVLETHHDAVVRGMFAAGPHVQYLVPYGPHRALATFGDLDGDRWDVEHVWITPDETRRLGETSRLTSVAELDAYAARAGLELVSRHSDLAGAGFGPTSVLSVGVYRRARTT